MVRFIIRKDDKEVKPFVKIYIPIWLDLLSTEVANQQKKQKNLHSNMVRFIICLRIFYSFHRIYLHSNMVRFIIMQESEIKEEIKEFTFQYG